MKESTLVYDGRKIPDGYLLAHNHVRHTPTTPNGLNGFRRFWVSPEFVKSQKWQVCPCGWHARGKWKNAVHYAKPDHVKWWKAEIKRRTPS